MTAVDLAICLAAVVALRHVLVIGWQIGRFGLLGPQLVVAGLLLISLFFVADLATMWVLPWVVSPPAAHAAMEALHLEWSWIVMLTASLVLSTGIVVSARRAATAEAGLERRRELYRAVVESQTGFIVRWQPNGVVTFANDAYGHYLERPNDEIVGTNFFASVVPEDARRVRRAIASLTPDSASTSVEHGVLRSEGEEIRQEWTHRAFFDPQGMLVELQSVGRDVTERRSTERKLRESEEQYRAIFVASRDGMTISRVGDERLIAVNPAFEELVGYREEELGRRDLEAFLHPDTLEHAPKMLEAMERGRTYRLVGKILRRDGQARDVSAEFVPMLFRGERHYLSVVRDITASKRAEEELRASEERASKVLRGYPEPTIISSLVRLQLIDVNPAFERAFGYTREEAIGRSSLQLDLWVDPEERENLVQQLRNTGTAYLPATEFRTRSGEIRVYEISAFTLELGRELCSAVIGRDVTERRQVEKALRESEEQYRAVFEASKDGMTVRALDDFRIITANSAFQRMVGYTMEELHDLPLESYISADILAERPSILESLNAGATVEVEGQILRRDGTSIDIAAHAIPLLYGGRRRSLTVTRDVTDEKRAKQELRASEEKFSRIFHGALEAIAIGSLETRRTIDLNQGFERLLGYSRQEVLRKEGSELQLWVNPQHREALFHDLERSAEVWLPEVELRTRSGEIIVCEMSAFTIHLENEPCWAAVVRDVTQRRHVELEKERAWMEISRLKEELERERDYLREEVTTGRNFGEIVGDSPALRLVLDRIEAVASTNATVLIEGESGVGKELVTREIHSRSSRGSGPLVRVNCASIPRDLFESEFFGHVKGSFTGAYRDRIGRFELAHRGTLFLDEVAEIPPEHQAKLLRALQEGEFQRVGEERTREVDVRAVAATNRNLKEEVEAGRFREDLYYRLSVFPVQVPPLRDREEDVLVLARHFLGLACREFGRPEMVLSRQQVEDLRRYGWPGNVRELRNVIEQAVILSRGERLRLDLALPGTTPVVDELVGAEPDFGVSAFVTAAELKRRERANLIAALEHARWKISGPDGAAELLGLKPTTLRYQMSALDIERPG